MLADHGTARSREKNWPMGRVPSAVEGCPPRMYHFRDVLAAAGPETGIGASFETCARVKVKVRERVRSAVVRKRVGDLRVVEEVVVMVEGYVCGTVGRVIICYFCV